MKETTKKKMKKITLKNGAIIVSIIFILVAICILVKPYLSNLSNTSNGGVKIITSSKKGKIDEDEAKKMALKQFKVLGEKDLKVEEINLIKINRGELELYYITSKTNSLEIQIDNSKIVRINNVLVEE